MRAVSNSTEGDVKENEKEKRKEAKEITEELPNLLFRNNGK